MKNLFFLGILAVCTLSTSRLMAQDSEKEAIYLEAIKANPNNFAAHYNLGVTYLKEQRFEKAIPELQKCTQLDPADKSSKTLLELCSGIQEMQKGNYSNASGRFQSALKFDPANSDAKRLLNKCNSKIYMDEKNYSAATTALLAVIQDEPKDVSAYKNLGFIYFQQKDYKKAVGFWTKAVNLQADPQIHKFLGFSYYNLGNFNDAIDHYAKSIALEKMKPEADQDKDSLDETYYDLGVAYNDNASFDQAAEAFGNAFRVNPKDANAAVAQAQSLDAAVNSHMEKASNFLLNNQYSDAIGEWNKVLKLQPENQQAQNFIADAKGKLAGEVQKHLTAGKVMIKKGDTVNGLNELNIAKKMDPENPDVVRAINALKVNTKEKVKALIAEGDEFYRSNDYSDALVSYLKAQKTDPHSTAAKKKVAMLRSKQTKDIKNVLEKADRAYDKRDYLTAKKYYQVALQLDPNNEKVKESLFRAQKDISNRVKELDEEGVTLFNSGNKEKAKADFAKVLEYKPNDDTANDYIKRMTGQQAQAKVDAEKVKALYYDGVNLYINGKIHEAIDKWKDCLKQDPNNVNAQANINKAMVKLQSIEKLSQN
ncbi:MAG TPA: tetratricopeptide repeat protein [bacterium]|nr:tetratricopeptide repeat protein [bacterium]